MIAIVRKTDDGKFLESYGMDLETAETILAYKRANAVGVYYRTEITHARVYDDIGRFRGVFTIEEARRIVNRTTCTMDYVI